MKSKIGNPLGKIPVLPCFLSTSFYILFLLSFLFITFSRLSLISLFSFFLYFSASQILSLSHSVYILSFLLPPIAFLLCFPLLLYYCRAFTSHKSDKGQVHCVAVCAGSDGQPDIVLSGILIFTFLSCSTSTFFCFFLSLYHPSMLFYVV